MGIRSDVCGNLPSGLLNPKNQKEKERVIQSEGERYRKRERQKDRQTDRQIIRQITRQRKIINLF